MTSIIAYGPAQWSAPPGTGGAGPWLIPVPARDARTYQSRGILTGQPGTQLIPAPDAQAMPPGNLPTAGRGPVAGWPRRRSSSRDSPQYWLPALYYQRVLPNGQGSLSDGTGLGPNVSVVSDNQMPVPAIDPRGRPAVMFGRPPRIGGRGNVPQPYALTGWPKWQQANPPAPQ